VGYGKSGSQHTNYVMLSAKLYIKIYRSIAWFPCDSTLACSFRGEKEIRW